MSSPALPFFEVVILQVAVLENIAIIGINDLAPESMH